MRTIILAMAIAGVAYGARDAMATQCTRWNNNLGPCDGLVASGVDANGVAYSCFTPTDSLPRPQQQSYFNWIYSSTPQKACKKLIYKGHSPALAETAVAVQFDAITYACWWDWDEDGSVYATGREDADGDGFDDNDFNGLEYVYLKTDIEREPECDLVPNGPYAQNISGEPAKPSVTPVAGGKFQGGTESSSQRGWIMGRSVERYGNGYETLTNAPGTVSDYGMFHTTRFTLTPYDDDAHPIDDTMQLPSGDDQAQIDHIIPRIELHGCACGTNSYANAAVISGTLNRQMSNDLKHPDRIRMLVAYVPGYVAPVPRLVEPGNDEGVSDEGGCSTKGGAGWLLALGIMAGVSRRRAAGRSS